MLRQDLADSVTIRDVAAHQLNRLCTQCLQLGDKFGRARCCHAATRRQQQMTHAMLALQMPRNLAAKLARPARDQHGPISVQTPRQLHHLLADVAALRHLPKRRRHLPNVVGDVRQRC